MTTRAQTRDAMQFINEQDVATLDRFIKRLEFRGTDPTFVAYREAYLELLDLAETYGPLAAKLGVVPAPQAEAWVADQRRSSEEGTFFAACNYYAYVAVKS